MSKHQLICVSIIELDINGEVLQTYRYPIIDDTLNQVIHSRCPLQNNKQLLSEKDEVANVEDEHGNVSHFMYSKFQDVNLYTCTQVLKQPLNQVTSFSICLCSKDYFPQMYQQCVQLLAKVYYESSFDPIQLLQVYISVFGSGKYKNDFVSTQFDKRKSKIGQVQLLADLFQEEDFCRIWTAVLLRKRVLIYSEKISELMAIVDACPSLCWHRANAKQEYNNFIRPFVNLSSEVEVRDLENMGVFIAGIMTEAKNIRYDLFVDISRREVTVSEQAANDFKLTKIHRDMYNAVKSELEEQERSNKPSNQGLIKVIATSTMDIIGKLKAIKESNQGVLNIEIFKAVSKQPDTQRFLYNIALAEGLLEQQQQKQQDKSE